MSDLFSIENICKQIHLYKDKDSLINRINYVHFMLLNYFLKLEDDAINIIDSYEISKLKEIGLYLFDLATDEMFYQDLDSKTRKDLFSISLNIFEQLCKIYSARYDEFINEYFELLIITVSCASLGDNPSKAYVIFNKYMIPFEKMESQEEILLYSIIAFFSKNYGMLNLRKKEISNVINKNNKLNSKKSVLSKITANIYRIISYLQTGDQSIVKETLLDLERLYKHTIDLNYYREIWIIKKIYKYIEILFTKSLWYVLGDKIQPETIKALLGNKFKPTYELWTHQIEIINNNLLDIHTNNIVNMPTSAGKSLIAQICILKVLQDYDEGTCIYVVPTNALLNQVKHDLNELLIKLNIDVDTLISGYDITNPDIEQTKIKNSKVLIVTQEKLDSLIRKEDEFLSKCKLFIFDEFQNISSNSRGLLLEFVVTKIKMMKLGNEPKLLFLSAVLPNVLKFKEWIGTDITKEYSNMECRPTKQVKIIGYYKEKYRNPNRGYYDEIIESGMNVYYENNRYGHVNFPTICRVVTSKSKLYKTQSFCADLAEKFVNVGNVLVYLPNTRWFKSFCKYMETKNISLSTDEQKKLNHIADYVALTMGSDHYLVSAIRRGFAYHHKRLPDNVKRIIEMAFKEGTIKVLSSTTTLAQGLNFPISTIILGNLNAGGNRMAQEEIENLIGRAGRAMRETEGYIILPIALKPKYSNKSHQKYISSMKENYLCRDIGSIIIKSAVEKLVIALKKKEEELDNREKDIIRMYNSIVFDLEENQLFQSEEDYLKIIEELFYSVYATSDQKEELIRYTKEMVSNIKNKINQIEDNTIKKILKNSGLSIDTAIGVYEAVVNNLDIDLDYVFDNKKLNPKFISVIEEINKLPEFQTDFSAEFIYDCINSWIFMDNYKVICEQHFEGNFDKCIEFINQNIVYKGAWYFSLIYQIYEKVFIDNNVDVGFDWGKLILLEQLSSLPAYCKFGVENKNMIELMDNGLYERELLIKAVTIFKYHTSFDIVFPEFFYEWSKYGNLVTIESLNLTITLHDKEQWKGFKIANREREKICIDEFEVAVKGYGIYDTKNLEKGEPILLRHEPNNPYDKFAIEIITLDNKKIGYIDKDYSKTVYEIIEKTQIDIWAFLKIENDYKLYCSIVLIEQ